MFLIVYVYLQCLECGGLIFSPNGTIRYPVTNSTHPDNVLNCVWIIQVKLRKVLNVSFEWIDIKKSSVCLFDYVEVRLIQYSVYFFVVPKTNLFF